MKARPMYNEEQKRTYLEQIESNKQRFTSIFRNTAPFEEAWGADLSTMPEAELLPMLEKVCGVRDSSKITTLSLIRSYMRWCVEQGFPGAHELGSINSASLASRTKTELVLSPAHLQQRLNELFAPEAEETQDNVYRCFLWLAYGGMREETAFNLDSGDVNLEYMEASRGDEVAVLYRQAMPAVRNCVRLTQFRYYNRTYTNVGCIYRDRVPGTKLLRGIREEQSMLNFRAQISRIYLKKRDEGIRTEGLTYSMVWLAGFFYRIYEGEQAGIEPDFHALAWQYQDRRQNKMKLSNQLRKDYKLWKEAVSSV